MNNQLSESVLISYVRTQFFIEGPFQNGQKQHFFTRTVYKLEDSELDYSLKEK